MDAEDDGIGAGKGLMILPIAFEEEGGSSRGLTPPHNISANPSALPDPVGSAGPA